MPWCLRHPTVELVWTYSQGRSSSQPDNAPAAAAHNHLLTSGVTATQTAGSAKPCHCCLCLTAACDGPTAGNWLLLELQGAGGQLASLLLLLQAAASLPWPSWADR